MDQTPELPPHLRKNLNQQDAHETDDMDDYVPELPPHLMKQNRIKLAVTDEDNNDYCPQLPPHLQNKNSTSQKSKVEESDDDVFCPALPPHLEKNKVYGAAMPPTDYVAPSPEDMNSSDSEYEKDDDDSECYGPMPAPIPVDMDDHIEQMFINRHKKKTEILYKKNEPKKLERESWMLELPEDRPLVGLGLIARQFTKGGKKDRGDTSVWTDTPVDKERKAQKLDGRSPKSDKVEELVTPETIAAGKRDERLVKLVEDYNVKKRSAPLIETHEKQKKQKKDADSLSVTGLGIDRKPFSREDDMHVNKFDKAQKDTILKKARQLNDRFSSGKSSKFL